MAILISLTLLFQAFYFKKKHGTFLFPAAIMSLAWFLFTLLPMLFLFSIPINPISIFYISICVFAFSLSSLHFEWHSAFELNQKNTNSLNYNNKITQLFFWTSAFLSIYFSTKVVIEAGFEFTEIILNLRKVSRRFAEMRPYGMITYGISGILSILFTYLTSILGGLAFYKYPHSRLKFLFLSLSFFPALYCMSIQSSKIIPFYAFGFFLGSHFLMKIKHNDLGFFSKKLFYQTCLVSLMLTPFFIFAFASRNRISDVVEILNLSIQLFKSYAFAELYAFADYFSFLIGHKSLMSYQHDLNSYGAYTFTSIYNSFGKPKLFPAGTYYDFYQYKDVIRTNIFTIFRGLINDFGIYGTIVYMYLTGLIAHFIYFKLLCKKSHIANALFILFVVYVQGMYLASVFMARFMYLIFVVMVIIFYINDKISNKNSKSPLSNSK